MAKLSFHKPHGKNRYCGPGALSAVTGLSSDDIAAIARFNHPGRGPVRGMSNAELVAVVECLGGKAELVGIGSPAAKQTLAQWLDARPDHLREKMLVINVTGHYVAALRDKVICTLQGREAQHILSARCRRWVFKRAWAITLPAKVALPDKLVAARKTRDMVASAGRKAAARARSLLPKLHLEVERDAPFLIVSMAESGTEFWRELLTKGGHELSAGADHEDVRSTFYNEVLNGYSMARDWSEVDDIVGTVAGYVHKVTGIRVDGQRGLIG